MWNPFRKRNLLMSLVRDYGVVSMKGDPRTGWELEVNGQTFTGQSQHEVLSKATDAFKRQS